MITPRPVRVRPSFLVDADKLDQRLPLEDAQERARRWQAWVVVICALVLLVAAEAINLFGAP